MCGSLKMNITLYYTVNNIKWCECMYKYKMLINIELYMIEKQVKNKQCTNTII